MPGLTAEPRAGRVQHRIHRGILESGVAAEKRDDLLRTPQERGEIRRARERGVDPDETGHAEPGFLVDSGVALDGVHACAGHDGVDAVHQHDVRLPEVDLVRSDACVSPRDVELGLEHDPGHLQTRGGALRAARGRARRAGLARSFRFRLREPSRSAPPQDQQLELRRRVARVAREPRRDDRRRDREAPGVASAGGDGSGRCGSVRNDQREDRARRPHKSQPPASRRSSHRAFSLEGHLADQRAPAPTALARSGVPAAVPESWASARASPASGPRAARSCPRVSPRGE